MVCVVCVFCVVCVLCVLCVWCVWCGVWRGLARDTCGRGAGTHGDVLNLHTEVFWTDTRGERERGGVTVSSANHETAHVELSRASEKFTERNPWFLRTQGLRTSREQLQSFALPDEAVELRFLS